MREARTLIEAARLEEAIESLNALDPLLAPISSDTPAGTDLRYDAELDRLKAARRAADGDQTTKTGWIAVAAQASDLLSRQSKDLQVAVWLVDAWARIDGLSGIERGLDLVQRLIDQYWDTLYPGLDPDEEPLGRRLGVMESLAERLPAVLKSIPLTGESGYGLLHFEVTQKTGPARQALIEEGWPDADQFNAALQQAAPAFVRGRREAVSTCLARLAVLERGCAARFEHSGQELLSFRSFRDGLEACAWLLDRAASWDRAGAPGSQPTPSSREDPPTADEPRGGPARPPSDAAMTSWDDTWRQALEAVKSGRMDGLRMLQDQVATARCGREAFLRQLQLAELCLEANLPSLAYPLLDELAHIIDDRRLDGWEDKTTLRRVWAALATSCRAMATTKPPCAERAEEAEKRVAQTSSLR